MNSCDVILDPREVNEWLKRRGFEPAHKMRESGLTPVLGATLLEQNDVDVALLGRFDHEGAANVLLVFGKTASSDKQEQSFLTIPLALLENVVEAMRATVGPDTREMVHEPEPESG